MNKLTEGLSSINVVVEEIRARHDTIKMGMPNSDERVNNEKRQEDLKGTIGILRRDAKGLSEKAARHQE